MSISFVEQVRRQHISAPIHKSFTLNKWEDGFLLFRSDAHCDALFQSGIVINKLLSSLRTEFNKILRWNDRATHIRYLIGTANRDDFILSQKIRNDIKPSKKNFLINEFQEYKVNLAFGESTPDEISQSIVESLSKAISELIKTEINSQVQVGDLDKLKSLSLEMGICGLYHWVESIWEDCLWNGYEFLKDNGNKYRILPTTKPDLDSAAILASTQYRRDTIILHKSSILSSLWHRKFTSSMKAKLMPIQLVSEIRKDGKKKRFILSSSNEHNLTNEIVENVSLSGFVAKDMVSLGLR